MHRDVSANRTRRREEAVARHNKMTHVRSVNFTVGDFVFVAQQSGKHGKKLRVKWRGPRRVIRAVSDLVFEFEDLITKQCSLLHANRLKFYAGSKLNTQNVCWIPLNTAILTTMLWSTSSIYASMMILVYTSWKQNGVDLMTKNRLGNHSQICRKISLTCLLSSYVRFITGIWSTMRSLSLHN